MELSTILIIVSAVLTGLTAFFGTKSELVKRKLNEAKNLLKEAVDVFTVSVEAVGDNKITEDEAEQIKTEVKEMIVALNKLLGKTV